MTSTEMSAPMSDSTPEATPPQRATVWRVFKDQRKIAWVALALMVASYWIAGQLGEWRLASCIAAGVLLGFLNHLATEFWLLKTITSGEQPTRRELAIATGVRLVVLTVVAVAIAVVLWPDGIGLLLGLAIFRLIALVMTSIPLLRQLKKEINP